MFGPAGWLAGDMPSPAWFRFGLAQFWARCKAWNLFKSAAIKNFEKQSSIPKASCASDRLASRLAGWLDGGWLSRNLAACLE